MDYAKLKKRLDISIDEHAFSGVISIRRQGLCSMSERLAMPTGATRSPTP